MTVFCGAGRLEGVEVNDMGVTGVVFNTQRFCVHDGPGIRTTVFLKGCPLRCSWCHNPEGLSPEPEISRIASRCTGCGSCREVCPDGSASFGGEGCTRCFRCAEACRTGALRVTGREMTDGEVIAECLKDRVFYEESGGGVTFSGGEPLSQPQFLLACLTRCREERLTAALDTCGYADRDILLEAAGMCDTVLYDLKVVDGESHKQNTGISNDSILDNFVSLGSRHTNVWVRIPVIPGVSDSEGNAAAAASLAAGMAGVRRVCLLPYHAMGAAKAGTSAEGRRLVAPGPEKLARLAAIFEGVGLNVFIGG